MTKLEAGQQRDNAEAAQQQNKARKQFGQGLGGIEPMSTNSDNNSLPITPQVKWLFSEWVELWCREGESNPQGTKYRRILSPLRLPVPPSRH